MNMEAKLKTYINKGNSRNHTETLKWYTNEPNIQEDLVIITQPNVYCCTMYSRSDIAVENTVRNERSC